MSFRRPRGQAIVEAALIAPVLLLLLAGAHVACRTVFLHSAAESAAHAEAIRAGRRLPGIEPRIAESIAPKGRGVAIRTEGGNNSRILPSPFPSMAGRTRGVAEISGDAGPMEEVAGLTAPTVTRTADMSVDCWGRSSPSGKKLRAAVKGIVAAGVFR